MKTKFTIPNWKPALVVTLAVLMIPALVGCVPSKLADRITDDQRAEFQARCMEVKGTFAGNNTWEVPKCTVIFDFPSMPTRESDFVVGGSDEDHE